MAQPDDHQIEEKTKAGAFAKYRKMAKSNPIEVMRDIFCKQNPLFYQLVSPYEIYSMLIDFQNNHTGESYAQQEEYYTKDYLEFILDASRKMIDEGDLDKA